MSKDKDLILYGIKIGGKFEDIITEADSMTTIELAKKWAKKNGYEKLRLWKYDGKAPDFTKVFSV